MFLTIFALSYPFVSIDLIYTFRMKTLSEKEEHRLLSGKRYVSLPDGIDEKNATRWRELEQTAHADPNIEILARNKSLPDSVPYKPAGIMFIPYLQNVFIEHISN